MSRMMDFVIENNILKGVTSPIDVDRKLGQVIYDALNDSPDHVTQIDAETGERTTCRQMKERSVRCALWMKKFGIGPEDIVVVVTHNHLDSCVPVFATFFLDAIFSAWHHELALYSARRFVRQFRPKLMFACERAVDVLAEAARLENVNVQIVAFGRHLNDILDSQTSEEVEGFTVVNAKSPQDVAAVMLSSGTTGFPKGVMVRGAAMLTMAGKLQDNYPTATANYVLWYSTLDWISCIILVLRALLRRDTRIVAGQTDVEGFFRVVQKYKVNSAFIPPTLVHDVAQSDLPFKHDLRSLKILMIGGCKHGKHVLEALKRKIPTALVCQGYSITEAGGVTFTTPETKNMGSAGFVLADCSVKFIDSASGKALGPNEKGEVYVKTPTFMIGYYGDAESTRRAFDEHGWYPTGDVGYYNESGEVFIVDRIKDILKYRNHQISPAEIEELLSSHPEVQEAAVVAIPHEVDGEWPTAFVTRTSGSRVTENDLMKLTSVLEDYKKLRGGIYFVDSLPRTRTGKIAKQELKQLAENLKSTEK